MKKIEFVNPRGDGRIFAPFTKMVYVFQRSGPEGARVAEVADEDAGDLLAICNGFGEPQFREVAAPFLAFDPAIGNYEVLSRDELRKVYEEQFGAPAPGRMKDTTIIEALRDRPDGTQSTSGTPVPPTPPAEPPAISLIPVPLEALQPVEAVELPYVGDDPAPPAA